MNLQKTVKTLLGIGSVDVAELNRRATLEHARSKLESTGSGTIDDIDITDEYEKVRALIEAGSRVVFVTGNAGTGKSTLIRYLRNVLDLQIAVVAPTGIAPLNVDGVTIHSFFQLPSKIHEEADIKRVYDRKLYQKLQLLVIDEVSMVRCDLIDSVDRFLRKNRSSKVPFGGVQLLLVGDLFQLPPVAQKQEWDVLRAKGYTSPYFFSSFSLQKTSLVPVELTVTYRQEDHTFVDLLNRTRIADDIDSLTRELNGRCWQQDGPQADLTLTSSFRTTALWSLLVSILVMCRLVTGLSTTFGYVRIPSMWKSLRSRPQRHVLMLADV
jgi:energy-coupling factor transporter ATP-binding protein EcfA2